MLKKKVASFFMVDPINKQKNRIYILMETLFFALLFLFTNATPLFACFIL
jgi:hypothetical protein